MCWMNGPWWHWVWLSHVTVVLCNNFTADWWLLSAPCPGPGLWFVPWFLFSHTDCISFPPQSSPLVWTTPAWTSCKLEVYLLHLFPLIPSGKLNLFFFTLILWVALSPELFLCTMFNRNKTKNFPFTIYNRPYFPTEKLNVRKLSPENINNTIMQLKRLTDKNLEEVVLHMCKRHITIRGGYLKFCCLFSLQRNLILSIQWNK